MIVRINSRKRERLSAFLIHDDNGRPLSMLALRSRSDKAGKAAGVAFQFRDIRAKTASDTRQARKRGGPGARGPSQPLQVRSERGMPVNAKRAIL